MTEFKALDERSSQHQRVEPLPTYNARALIAQGAQARLVLDEKVYFLRITRAGKLILTK